MIFRANKWSLVGAKRAIVVGGSLAMAYTQLTTSPATTEFARSLGADGLHIGILGALPTGLFFMQFVAAMLVCHLRYRRWVWIGVSLAQRISFLPLALVPFVWPNALHGNGVWVLIGLTAANHALLHFSSPLWLSWMGDYLPHRGLSRFWGVRHRWQQWSAAAALCVAAAVFWGSGLEMRHAYGLLMAVATVLGVADVLLFLKVEEPPVGSSIGASGSPSYRAILIAPFRDPQFRTFIEYTCFWHFAAMVGAPFIGLYLLEHVGMSLFSVLLLWGLSWIGGALMAGRLGAIAEEFGNRPLLILCTTLKAVNMLALLLTPANPTVAFWVLVPVLMMDAQLNAGISIANQGFLLKYSPRENRTMFIAAGTALAGMVGGVTAVAAGYGLTRAAGWSAQWGGWSITNFHVVFAISAVLRIAAIGLARRVHEPTAAGTRHVMHQLIFEQPWPFRWRTRRRAATLAAMEIAATPVIAEPLVEAADVQRAA